MEPDPPERRGGSVLRALGIGLAVILGVLFLVTCGRLLKELSGNDTHQPETGGAAVQLLPPGQTYPPTAVPIATVPVTASHSSGGNVSAAEPPSGEESPVRTRRSTYPKNQLCNVVPLVKELRAANPDSVGRLVIPGLLEEKVVQRNNIYYLTHDATGAQSSAGAVFVDETCSYKQPPENLLLRGQSTVEGRVFAPLNYFITGGSGFAYTARTAVLTMPYEEEQYFLFAVVKASTDPASPDYFDYASHPSFATDTDMMTYAASAMARSLYQFGVEVDASDRLLTLATVSGGGDSVVLIYRMAREGEV